MNKPGLRDRVADFLDRQISWLFPLPALMVAGGLFVYPFIRLVWLSFTEYRLTRPAAPAFIGLANYAQALSRDAHFWKAVWLTLYFAFGSVVGQFILGFALALLLNREFKGESFFRTFMLFPIIATPVAMSLVWSMLMNPMMGHLNYYLSLLGLGPSAWAADVRTVMPSLIMIEVWHWSPMTMLILLAGLKTLPPEPFEAAVVDGANKFQIFCKITLPLMQPYIVLLLILRLVHGLKVFDTIFVISSGGGNLEPHDLPGGLPVSQLRLCLGPGGRDAADHPGGFDQPLSLSAKKVELLSMARPGFKRTLSRTLFYFILALVTVLFFFPFYWVVATSLQDPQTAAASPPRFLFTPTLDNYRDVLSSMGLWRCLWNSTAVVLLTLAANLIISLPAAYVIARRRQRWLSFAILFFQMAPWIVLLLPWYIIFKKMGLYDTHIGLVLANLTYMIPFSVWLLQGFFADVPVEVEEAAWLDGCSKMGTFVRIVVPLVSGGILTVCTLGFIFCWNIFLFPLVLSGSKAKTLPVLIYGFMADNQLDFGPLAAAAVLITLPVLVFTLANQKYFRRGIALGGRK